MTTIKLKELLTVLIFSLFIFANPAVNTFTFDTGSETETVLEFEEELEVEEDSDEEVKKLFFSHFAFSDFYSENIQLFHKIVSHTYRTNPSLLKPPIFNS